MTDAPQKQLFLLGQQLCRLSQAVPLAERKQHVCEASFDDKAWEAIDRPDLCAQATSDNLPSRVGLACDAGLGKTTNVEWLQAHLARRGGRQLPLLVRLDTTLDRDLLEEEFNDPSRTPLLNRLAKDIFLAAGGDTARHLVALTRRQTSGRLTLLIDGLDHVSGLSSFQISLKKMLESAQWRRCPVWVAGRPMAFDACWNKLLSQKHWQFLRVMPLAEPEIGFYLSRNAGGDWYDVIPAETRPLLAVPRFLHLICGILRKAVIAAGDAAARQEAIRALKLHTPADVYHLAFFQLGDADDSDSQGLLAQGLRGSAERIGLGKDSEPLWPNRGKRVARTAALLGAIAFQMLDGDSTGKRARPNFGGVKLDPFQDHVASRMQAAAEGTPSEFDRDFPLLKDMNVHALDFLLFRESDNQRLAFHDRTVQSFFAAYWACRHAATNELPTTRQWVVDPLLDGNLDFAEFWRFAAEMREEALPQNADEQVNWERWLTLFRPLYDGSVVDEKDRPIRSTEFIFRSWTRMASLPAGPEILTAYRRGNRGPLVQELIAGFLPLVRGGHPGEPMVFTMGAPAGEDGWDLEDGIQDNPEHEVALSPYYLHRFCVTNLEYELFDPRHRERRWDEKGHPDVWAAHDPSADGHYPVVNVTWYSAWCCARWLGKVEWEGRWLLVTLPSEAQWEYACRAGRRTPFSFDGDHDGQSCTSDLCNFDGKYPYPDTAQKGEDRGRTVAANGLGRNPWGFYQMHGNVWEWCEDGYAADFYRRGAGLDPVNREPASARVLRGGGWDGLGGRCRSADRYGSGPDARARACGFRLAAVPVVGARPEASEQAERRQRSRPE